MRCLEDICKQELIEEDTIELLSMDNSDIDIFMTNEEYAMLNLELDVNKVVAGEDVSAVYYSHAHATDDDNAIDKNMWDDNKLDTNSIVSYYAGTAELDALSKTDINMAYDRETGEEKYDG